MSGFVKVCGITTVDAVAAAVESGVDACGFVFSPSARLIGPMRAALLADDLPARVKRVAVFRHPPRGWIETVLADFPADWVQSDAEDLDGLTFRNVEPLPVVRAGSALPESVPARMLFEGPHSGSGAVTNWKAAARLARRTSLMLAGGLTAENVGEAVRAVRPWGVDVSTGVERERGVKDPERVAAFVSAARRAFAELKENGA